jgi:hypothetical protein
MSIVGAYYTFGNVFAFSVVLIVTISLFLALIALYTDCKLAKLKVENKIQLIHQELGALKGDFSMCNPGLRHENNSHPYSSDLDFFKPNGIFAFLNRTTSNAGENELVSMLLDGNEHPSEINKIVEDIANTPLWMMDFRAVGMVLSKQKESDIYLHKVSEIDLAEKSWFKIARWVLPICAFLATILFNFNLISTTIFSCIIVLVLIPISKEVKNTNAIAAKISFFENRIKNMRDQLLLLNNLVKENDNELWVNALFKAKPIDIAKKIDELVHIIGRFNTRSNLLLGMPLNIFFAWDFQQRIKLENWIRENKEECIQWESGLAKIEAYISAATMRFNYPKTIYANRAQKGEKEMIGLTHPLLAHTNSVSNDFYLNDQQQFMILTGPNMAGKSTYLRAIGCALVFANAGFPVFASTFSYPYVQVFTSMRTADNISENSSYFFAELNRLRKMMDTVEQNKSVFVLLDEILKGTNSKDKEEGSYLFMQKMQSLGAEGVIATHDLSLCQLEEQSVAFYTAHFDSTIQLNDLTFDYKLQKGVCKNMNASFLLRKMNLVN